MIVKIKDKEYSFDGYANPISSVQRLAEGIYQQGRADAYKELAPLFDDIVTMDNICDALDSEWCEKNCTGDTSKCLSRYVEQLKEKNNE